MKLSDILSFVAIVISILVVMFQYNYTFRINKNSLMSTYYSDTYKKYLTELLPNARMNVSYDRQSKFLSGTDMLEYMVLDIRKESLYFKYQNTKFYDKLMIKLDIIDDLIVENGQKRLAENAFKEFEIKLDVAIANMYKLINYNYIGK